MEKILIIGNGFDVNLGLNTSYKCFLGSAQFKGLLTSNNLAKYLQAKQDAQLWVDVEHELKKYANAIFTPIYSPIDGVFSATDSEKVFLSLSPALRSEFVELKKALSDFLEEELESAELKGSECSNAHRLIKYGTLFDEQHVYFDFESLSKRILFNQIFTLNYTKPSLLDYLSRHSDVVNFIHGSLSQNNIVFGVEDNSVPDDCAYLLKSEHAAFGKAPDLLSCLFGEAKSFHFFGCSLGDTDNAHFGEFFLFLAKNNNELAREPSKHQLFFYVYGKEGYQQIRNRISRLTNGQMARFKLNNDVVFYDIKDNKVVDQTYLNQI